MTTESKLTDLWENIDYRNGGSLMLEMNHPLKWYVSYTTETQKSIVIISKALPTNLESSKSISTRVAKRMDGKYATFFSLTEKNQEPVFISMCANLIDYSLEASSEIDALKKVAYRFRQWQRLMAYKRAALMSVEAQKGLIGELIFLEKEIESGRDIQSAVEGWVGPNGADQDFVYDEAWHEIKAVGLSSTEVTISSLEQLGTSNETGELIVERIDKCAPEAAGAFSLNDKVKKIVTQIMKSDEVLDTFVSKLNCVGYIDIPEYDEIKYKYSGEEAFVVNESFPRLMRNNVYPEIVNVKYTLSIPGIFNWKK